MGKHSVPHGEKSSLGAANGSPGTKGYEGQHRHGSGMIPLGDRSERRTGDNDYDRDDYGNTPEI